MFEETEMLYLRKANQIHSYIVNRFADGRDECQRIYLEIEEIKNLKELCERILKEEGKLDENNKMIKSDLAKDLLPTQEGFFFGGTEYDKWYLEDLTSYIKQADEILADYESEIQSGVDNWDIDYYYLASW